MSDPTKCPFCEKGQAWRLLAWRIVKDFSRPEMQAILKDRKTQQEMRRRKENNENTNN